MITTCTRVFIRAARNKSAAFRELLAIISGVTDLETIITSHQSEVIILSDSISLSLIVRQKFSNNKLLEISLFLSTFSNLTIVYFPGTAQFFVDALSRQFDKIYLENKTENLSKYFGEIHPPANKSFIGCKLNNQQFRDLLLRSSYTEKIDVFSKCEYYSMNSHRYMNLQTLKVPKVIPTEIDYLSHIWLGLNSPDVTKSQLVQLTNQIKFYPTSALKEAKDSTNLTRLREKLMSLKDARLFSAVLKEKYFLQTLNEQDINL